MQWLKYSFFAQKANQWRHRFWDIFTHDFEQYAALDSRFVRKKATVLGNGPSLNARASLPIYDVLVCNHFWRHPHYAEIKSGFHLISDPLFLKADDIERFFNGLNPNLVLLTSTEIRKWLLHFGVNDAVYMPVNYSGGYPNWEYDVKKSSILKQCYTGSTVICDLGFPVLSQLKPETVELIGVDLDYGKDLKAYAFSASNSVTAPDFYMKNIWPNRAPVSVQKWIYYFRQRGIDVIWD